MVKYQVEDIYKIMKTGLLDILKESINEGGVKKDLYTNLKLSESNKFENIQIFELGTGPFLACISLLRSYLKYLPIFYQLLVFLSLIIDKLIKLIIKTDPKKMYPIGYVFFASNR